ncbi:MAG TPA: hypothetical protein VGO62_11315, partial [Myxococcota bacterium]
MPDSWDERTEAIPGSKADKSFELELDFAIDDALPGLAQRRPSLVVFEPAPLGLAGALSALGYAVEQGGSGVEVMTMVAARIPAAVICAPSPDAERRRLLAAALRLRFPTVPILYVSTHAAQQEAVLGAVREGARAVIAWPLPTPSEVSRVLAPYLDVGAALAKLGDRSDDDEAVVTPPRPLMRPTFGEVVPAVARAPFEDVPTDVTNLTPPAQAALAKAAAQKPPQEKAGRAPSRVTSLPPDAMKPLPVPLPVTGPSKLVMTPASRDDDELEEPTTQPNMPAAKAAIEAAQQKRGELGELLAAVSPFLWSL